MEDRMLVSKDELVLWCPLHRSIEAARHAISALPEAHVDNIFVHHLAPECFLVVFSTQ
jgi:hypothetical protein